MILDYNLIGTRIATLRHQRRWTQEKLAELAGLSNNYISNIENHHSIPSLETLVKICAALEVTPDTILLGSAPQSAHYLEAELAELFSRCTPRERRSILRILTILIDERDSDTAE